MKRAEDSPIDPEVLAALDAIDATLAGEPVAPRHAELAELALLLADERPHPRHAFAAALDRRVADRFAPRPVAPGGRARRSHHPRTWWATLTTGGLAVACLAVAFVLVISESDTTSRRPPVPVSSSASAGPAARAARPGVATAPAAAGAPAATEPLSATSSGAAAGAVSPPANGRKIIRSAALELSAAPRQIDGVAQQVFDVVGAAGGIVDRSSVTQTGGLDGAALFELRLPSAALETTLGRLSQLRGATVLSRSDNSEDVNSEYVSTVRALADARALRAALLKQLAAAQTTGQIDSLHARIATSEATIASEEAALRSLDASIGYSRVTVTITAGQPVSPPPHQGTSGFGLGRAAHLAGRVLVVAAGIALIGLAALVPVGLLATVMLWAGFAVRRRRRDHALDLV